MNCQQCFEKIGPLLMDDLEPPERREVLAHLQECQDCQQEKRLLQETLGQLGEVRDMDVPHHFFIQPETGSLGPLGLLRRLSRGWKAALAAATLALLLSVASAMAGLQVRWQDGALAAGFGTLPAAGASEEQVEAIAMELARSFEESLAVRDAALRTIVHKVSELEARPRGLNEAELEDLRLVLADFEESLKRGWRAEDAAMAEEVRGFVRASYENMRRDYSQRMMALGESLLEFQQRDEVLDERVSMLGQALVGFNELYRNRRGENGE